MDPQTVLMELNEEHQEIVGEVRQYFLAVE